LNEEFDNSVKGRCSTGVEGASCPAFIDELFDVEWLISTILTLLVRDLSFWVVGVTFVWQVVDGWSTK
jgi:hypothetical protein